MPLNLEQTRKLLQSFDFKALFVEELGWDRYATTLDVSIDGQNYTLSAIAEKRGMVVFVCEPFLDKWERILIDYLGYPIVPVNLHGYP